MKYVVDIDSLINCLDYLDAIKVNGALFNQTEVVKEFIHFVAINFLNEYEHLIKPYLSPRQNTLRKEN